MARARQIQHRTYWLLGLWVLVNVAVVGLLIWADAFGKGTAGIH